MSYLDSLPPDARIFDVFTSRPEVYRPFVEMVERVTRGASPLTRGERELIGARVSSLNRCPMCVDIHQSAARAHGIGDNDVSEKLEVLLAFVDKLTTAPHEIVPADARAVYAAGWDEAALHDAVAVACIAGFMNRFVFGLGIDADDAYRDAAGRAVEQEGYQARFEKRRSETDDDAEA